MSEQIREPKPLYLSAEEAMGLLDLCLLSRSEFDAGQESVVLKLSDLVRRHLTARSGETNGGEATGGVEDEGADAPVESVAEFAHSAEDVTFPFPATERIESTSRPPCPARSVPRSVSPIRYWMAG